MICSIDVQRFNLPLKIEFERYRKQKMNSLKEKKKKLLGTYVALKIRTIWTHHNPAGQALQAAAEKAPTTLLQVPGRHNLHDDVPSTKLPAGHCGKHSIDVGREKVPEGQGRQDSVSGE